MESNAVPSSSIPSGGISMGASNSMNTLDAGQIIFRHGYHGPPRSAPYPMSLASPAFSRVDSDLEIALADDSIRNSTLTSLETIATQIAALKEQARNIIDKAVRDAKLHRAECRLLRKRGHVYHLYERNNGSTYMALLSPDDWNGHPPDKFVGSYLLDDNYSWVADYEMDERMARRRLIPAMLGDVLKDAGSNLNMRLEF